jgi:hypothetical protein
MKTALVLCVLFFIAALLPAYADFKLVGKVPAPQPDSGCTEVTGLGVAEGNLFATVKCDTTSFLYLLDPDDGSVIEQKEYDGSPPDCPGEPVRLVSGAYEDSGYYWLGDSCGNFINVSWDSDSLVIHRHFMSGTVEVPSGLCYQSDTLFVVDYHTNWLLALDTLGNVLAADSLMDITSPTGLTLYRDHFFLSSANNDSMIFEINRDAAMIDTHLVRDLVGTVPLSATFFDGLLYVGSAQDSILIFEPTTYNTCIPPGDSVTIEAVPGKLFITFDHVDNACCVFVDVADSQACPPPDLVEFYSDVYEITTCLRIDWEAQLSFEDTSCIPEHPECVRVFSRPSGSCMPFRDITVDTMEIFPVLRTMSRMQSEDDEFSVFAIGVDRRDPRAVIDLKFSYTREAITSNEDSIPPGVYNEITSLLDSAETVLNDGFPFAAAGLVDTIADIVRDTPGIPHTYYPGEQGHNIAGLIISNAHTLSFSLGWCGGMAGVPGEAEDAASRLVLYPNPSKRSVMIEFESLGNLPVTVSIYSARGRLVKELLRNKVPKRRFILTWQGDNDKGHPVSPGAYFVVAKEGNRITAGKVILRP